MRRKDRILDENNAKEIMHKARYCVLSSAPACVSDFELPKKVEQSGQKESYEIFSIPVSFVYAENTLFIHTAKAGRKIAFFKDNTLICAVFVGDVEVPNLFSEEELQQIARDEPKKLGSHVFTTEYESVIAYGRIRQILNYEEQNRAMALLCQKYMPDKAAFVQHSVDTERKHFECLWHRAYSYQRKGEDSLKSLAS